RLSQEKPNRVRVDGIKGKPETPFYKVSISYSDGFKLSSTLVYAWPDAALKARKAGEILKTRATDLGLDLDRFRVEMVGYNSCNEADLADDPETNEVQMRFSVAGASEQ